MRSTKVCKKLLNVGNNKFDYNYTVNDTYCAEVLHIKKKIKSGMKVKVKYKIKYLPKI